MKANLSPPCALILVMVVCASIGKAAETAPPVEFTETSEWFDRLDIPPIDGKSFVCITIRDSSGAEQIKAYGFVLARYQNIHTILTTDLRQIRLPAPGVMPWKIKVDADNLEDYAKKVLIDVNLYDKESSPSFCWETGIEFRATWQPLTLSPSARDFFLARACFAHAHDAIGEQLARRSVETKPGINRPPSSSRAELEAELYMVFMDRARASLTNVGVDREEALSSFVWIANNLKYAHDPNEANKIIAVLRRMVQEDRSWTPNRPRIEKRSPEDLIYDLRNQTAVAWHATQLPGYLSPAEQLLDLRQQAVPALIEAIGDERLTRTAIGNRSVYPKVGLTTIGQYAITILEDIAGERMPVTYTPASQNAEQLSRKREELRRFWKSRADRRPSR